MKERSVVAREHEVRAILEGRQTQLRRTVKSPAKDMQEAGIAVIQHRPPGDPRYGSRVWSMRGPTGLWSEYTHAQFIQLSPYGTPGDRLWVREMLRGDGQPGDRREGIVRYGLDGEMVLPCSTCGHVRCVSTCEGLDSRMDVCWEWMRPILPAQQMPRWASRITLDVVDVRLERLQDITERDARAEGVEPFFGGDPGYSSGGWHNYGQQEFAGEQVSYHLTARKSFESLWHSINGRESWDANPWVWVVSFKRVTP